jgi:hypothetical protein
MFLFGVGENCNGYDAAINVNNGKLVAYWLQKHRFCRWKATTLLRPA